MDVTYRRMQPDEADAAAALHRKVGRVAWHWTPDLTDPEQERQMYRETVFAHGEVWGAFEEETLIGFIATLPGWVEHLFVATERQGGGIGGELLDIAMNSQDDLQLWTYQANTLTRRFYESRGFRVAELSDGATLPEREPNVRYLWKRLE